MTATTRNDSVPVSLRGVFDQMKTKYGKAGQSIQIMMKCFIHHLISSRAVKEGVCELGVWDQTEHALTIFITEDDESRGVQNVMFYLPETEIHVQSQRRNPMLHVEKRQKTTVLHWRRFLSSPNPICG